MNLMDYDKRLRIDELVEKLTEANKAYYEKGIEMMTNFEYDEAYDELLALEDETGYVRDDSPSINVGYEIKTALPKVVHETKMLSMNKTKDREELRAWLGDKEALLSWKLDGITIVLTYNNGRLESAATRGNGVQGELITANALACRNVPKTIPCKGRVVVRGEAVIRYSDFEKINEAIDDADAKYKNPRNLCSGSIRQLDPKVTAERDVNVYIFSLYSIDMSNAAEPDPTVTDEVLNKSRRAKLEWVRSQGFDVVEYHMVNADTLLEEIDRYETKIPTYDIPSDGLVLTLEDAVYAKSLGVTAKFPKDAMAFKWRDQNAETVLREIEWSPSRTGLLNPVAIFDPVELEGTTVSRASVHNINIMEDLKLGIGDTIVVYKANMIIPQISGNLTRSGLVDIPDTCPVCGGSTEIRDEEGTRTLHCINPDCLAKHVKKLSLFVSRDALNIEGLSEQGLLKFIGAGFLRTLPDIFRLSEHRDEIVAMEGFGEKSYDNLTASIDKARSTTPARLLYGLGVPGIGVTNSNMIARACRNDWNTIQNLDEEVLLEIDGVGGIMAHDYVTFFGREENKVMLEDLLSELKLDESYQAAGNKLDGKTFVITGSLENYANRKDLKAEIEAEGGKVAGSVSAKTDYLITNDPGSGSSKNKAARELGIAIITEKDIMNMLGH